MARLLMAEGPDGVGLATLFLLRVGDRVIEPYGGMTEAGAECRANYLLKWEAIRTSREQGATSYDMWGLSHEGIEHFKTGFGGREIKLRRGLGPRPRPGRPPGVRQRSGRCRTGSAPGATASARSAAGRTPRPRRRPSDASRWRGRSQVGRRRSTAADRADAAAERIAGRAAGGGRADRAAPLGELIERLEASGRLRTVRPAERPDGRSASARCRSAA